MVTSPTNENTPPLTSVTFLRGSGGVSVVKRFFQERSVAIESITTIGQMPHHEWIGNVIIEHPESERHTIQTIMLVVRGTQEFIEKIVSSDNDMYGQMIDIRSCEQDFLYDSTTDRARDLDFRQARANTSN